MSSRPLWKVSISTFPEVEDVVAETLSRILEHPASIFTDVRTGRTTVSVFCPEHHGWIKSKLPRLKQALAELKTLGLPIGPARLRAEKMRPENWAESWKRHFKPIVIGHRLLVKPGWSRRRPKTGQALVILDPGLSFGTGQHATTLYCLHALVRHRRAGQLQSVLDVGTGSGILAITAAKLGYVPVEAFDVDTESIRVASANARRNRVAASIKLYQADVLRLPSRSTKKFDVVCANLISPLLIAQRRRIISRLGADGVLVIAGILTREFSEVRRAFEGENLRLAHSRRQGEWTSGTFLWQGGKILNGFFPRMS